MPLSVHADVRMTHCFRAFVRQSGVPRSAAGDDDQLAAVAERIREEQGGLDLAGEQRLGRLRAVHRRLALNPNPFWEQLLGLWDSMHRIGVRAHYLMSALVAPMMFESATGGLIVSLSSFAGRVFVPPVPYGVALAAIDRLAHDVAEDLRPHNVASVSLYPGMVLTEAVIANLKHFPGETNRETPLFVGWVVAALAADSDRMRLTGRWLVAAELAAAYGVVDEKGRLPQCNRARFLKEKTSLRQ